MNLLHLFDLSLRARRDAPALEWEGTTYTFGEIDARSNRVANALIARGFAKGDRLCVYLANRIELIDLFLACVKLGVIFVPINILYREREIAHITNDAEPRDVITADNLFTSDDDRRPDVMLDGDTPAAIIYTSGTTGASKGAVLTHDNFLSNAVNLTTCWQITDRDRFLLPLPLFHIHALGNGLHAWLASGCRMRLLERFDHRTAVDQLIDFQPTLFFGVPTVYVRLLETPPDAARAIGEKMRLFVSGSAPLPAHVLEQFRALFGHTILERYGMTETFMNTSNPYAGERRAGTVGVPLPGISVRIVDGELQVRGSNVFAGYWRRPDPTAAAFTSDGYFRTGDLAEVSDDGYYTLLGRKSDLIISGGFNIYPREIEEMLLEHVREAAVVGEPDEIRGEVPVAYITGDFDAAQLERICREQLASFKVPRRFVRVDAIPRTALGKVQKHLIRFQYRPPTSHERMTGLPWDASYRDGPAPWDIGGPQPAVVRLAAAGAFAGTVLDAGCGTGENALHIASLGLSVAGVDVAETALAIAREKARDRNIEIEFAAADALQLQHLKRTFDTVLDCGLFHTFDHEERPRYVASLASVTARDGTLYVLCFSDEGADLGPHPVSQEALRAAFSGWNIIAIEPERLQTRFHNNGVAAWLATIKRI
ncbi:MAG: hypothetical protein DMF56_10555 [Acidobacteria bacterium]|nr:MAG: hypothetical protein DMF56_10555 [Acidobacteriota bacterium]